MVVSLAAAAFLSFSLIGCLTPAATETAPETPAPASEATPATDPSVPAVSPSQEPDSTVPQTTAENTPATDYVRVAVIYFHRTSRCHSCQYAEDQTVYTLENNFAEELANGTITFQSIDIQDAENAATIEKYGAYASQMFITTVTGDTERTDEIIEFWDYIDDDAGFTQMIISLITEAMEGAS